jgi:Uma2 family endonuclease
MNVVQRQQWTIAPFLAWEERQERPWEFDGVQPVAMNGGTIGHEAVSFNIRTALGARLAGGGCRPFGPLVKILAGRSVRYPDAVVSCTAQRTSSQIIEAPVVVFEVLSPSTSRTDRIDKLRDYGEVATIRRYVIPEQESIAAAVFERADDAWKATTLTAEDVLDLPEIGITVPLAEFYAGIAFSDETDAPV